MIMTTTCSPPWSNWQPAGPHADTRIVLDLPFRLLGDILQSLRYLRSKSSSRIYCLYFVEYQYRLIRCEFTDSYDSEAFLISDAFFPRVPLLLVVQYNISSADTAVEILIVSALNHSVMQNRSLSHHATIFVTFIQNISEPIYVVVDAYAKVATATSSSSSVTIEATSLTPAYDSG